MSKRPWRRCAACITVAWLVTACNEFPSDPPLAVAIEAVNWPASMDVGETDTLQIQLHHAEQGELQFPRVTATWESSNTDIVEVQPLPSNTGNPATDSLASHRTRVQAIARGPGVAVVTVRVAGISGIAEVQRSFDIPVRLWTQAIGLTFSTCGVTGRGLTYCWGANVGSATPTPNPVPRVVAVPSTGTGLRLHNLTSGQTHVCGEGSLIANLWFCWGQNFFGQLTNGTTIPEIFPVPMNSKDVSLTGLSVSDNVSCGVGPARLEQSDRTQIYCWGQPVPAVGPTRSDYQYPDILSPVAPETSDWRCDLSVVPCPAYYAVAVGQEHACGLYLAINAAQGRVESVVCWGDNSKQQIGRPPSIISRITAGLVYQAAVPLNVPRALLAIVSMKNSSCVLDQGALFCWGDFFGATPTRVLPNVLLGMIAASPEGDQVCGVGLSDDKAYCVATSSGATIPTSDLAEDGTQLRFTSIMTAGEAIDGTDLRHFCGITRVEGAMYCWGDNTFGQLGQDTRGVRVVAPVKVQTPALE